MYLLIEIRVKCVFIHTLKTELRQFQVGEYEYKPGFHFRLFLCMFLMLFASDPLFHSELCNSFATNPLEIDFVADHDLFPTFQVAIIFKVAPTRDVRVGNILLRICNEVNTVIYCMHFVFRTVLRKRHKVPRTLDTKSGVTTASSSFLFCGVAVELCGSQPTKHRLFSGYRVRALNLTFE